MTSRAVRLRVRYTGEPKAAALHAFRQSGMHFGLVPDALDAGQRRLEATLLRTLARPHPGFAQLSVAGSVWGLSAASPAADGLVIWPAHGQAAQLLARWLPTRAPGGELGGVPGLRVAPLPERRRDTLSLALAGRHAHVELRAEPAVLRAAARLAAEAGCEVLWERDAASREESEALVELTRGLETAEVAVWSRALRRLGVAQDVFGAWRHRAPLEQELEGPKPERIAPRPTGPGVALRGVVAVLSADGRGGSGCTTAAYMMAAAAAAGGARVGFLAGDDPSNLPALLGQARASFTGWRDASQQLPAGGHLKVALAPKDPAVAAEYLTAVRADFDVVVVDAGNGFQLPHLAAQADAVLALLPDQVSWYSQEVLDDRSARVQIWSHLNDQPQPGHWRDDLPTFLDEAFEHYVQWRAEQEGLSLPEDGAADEEGSGGEGLPAFDFDDEDGEAGDEEGGEEGQGDWEDDDGGWVEPYDPDFDDDVEMFWSRGASPHPYGATLLPPEETAPYLDRWREDFLQVLTPQGQRRHPDQWPRIVAGWSERNRARNLERLPVGAPTAVERAAAEEELVASLTPQALERWDEQLWQRESTAWRAAGLDERHDVGRAEDDLLWTLHHPRPAEEVAGELRMFARQVPYGRPVVLGVTRLRQDLDRHLLADVRQALQGQGIAGLALIARSRALQSWIGAQRLDASVLAVGWSLAASVLDAVEQQRRPAP
ncbi:hypothetical protein ABZ851_29870 [Streptomyces sp. NPDC047049]|uniref:hypothetical protein n=1 Tax=Streptomyces sp. NPDC047049 TaxID=3156688 RepID=UPI0033E50D78